MPGEKEKESQVERDAEEMEMEESQVERVAEGEEEVGKKPFDLLYLLYQPTIALCIVASLDPQSAHSLFSTCQELRNLKYMDFAKIYEDSKNNVKMLDMLKEYVDAIIEYHVGRTITNIFPCEDDEAHHHRKAREFLDAQSSKLERMEKARNKILDVSDELKELKTLMNHCIMERNKLAEAKPHLYSPQNEISERTGQLYCTTVNMRVSFHCPPWRLTEAEKEELRGRDLDITEDGTMLFTICIHFVHSDKGSRMAQDFQNYISSTFKRGDQTILDRPTIEVKKISTSPLTLYKNIRNIFCKSPCKWCDLGLFVNLSYRMFREGPWLRLYVNDI